MIGLPPIDVGRKRDRYGVRYPVVAWRVDREFDQGPRLPETAARRMRWWMDRAVIEGSEWVGCVWEEAEPGREVQTKRWTRSI